MSPAFSVYLDIVRFVAACLVYVWHSNQRTIITDILPASGYGHSAVTVFFVLSGFVIAYVTDTKERHWTQYASSRLSRVYSVVLPTLLLTLILDAIGRSIGAQYYGYPFDRFALRIVGSGLMLNEIWLISITYFSNVPYWSIAFESWYYLIFGLMVFAPPRLRPWLLAATALLVGPKILLLLPVWLTGVVLYRWDWPHRWSRGLSWGLVAASVLAIVAFHMLHLARTGAEMVESAVGPALATQLTFAQRAPSDWLLGALVFVNFAAVRNVAADITPLMMAIARPVRWLAGFTFTLYLMHQPLFLFWAAVVRGDPSTWWTWGIVTLLTAVSVVAIGTLTEHRRQAWRERLQRLLVRIDRRVPAAAART